MDVGGGGGGAADRLVSAIQDLSLARTVEEITAVVSQTARELSGADGATFVLRDSGLCRYVDEDAIAPLWKGRYFPIDACISGWVMLHREAATVPDVAADPRIPMDAYRPTFVKSLVMVPIRTADPMGAIGAYWATVHQASDDDVRHLQALANATAVSMERLRVFQELERRVQDRTSELEAANRRLTAGIEPQRQTREFLGSRERGGMRMQAQRDQLVGILASVIAHELNQPLTAAITYVSTAQRLLRGDRGGTDRAVEALEKATAQNWRAAGIVRQFRETLRRGEPDFQSCDLREVIRSAFALVQERADEHGFALGLDMEERLGPVCCDWSQIEHVVLNLLRNALEAMREANVTAGSVRGRVRLGRPGFVRVSIADDGPGLSPRAETDLFMPLRTTKVTGLGLGLPISRVIVQAHGGELWADPANERGNAGATFHFTLPLSDSDIRPPVVSPLTEH